MSISAQYLKQVLSQNKVLVLVMAIAIIWSFFGYQTEGSFLTSRNFSNLFRQMAITGMTAAGMMFVIVAAEIDLSIGSLFGLLGGIAAILDSTYGVSLFITIPAVLLAGVGFGALTGYCTAYLKVPSFIVTLGGQLVFRGILLGLTSGATIALSVNSNLIVLGQGYLPLSVGNILGVLVFAILAVSLFMGRKNRMKHQLPVPAMWKDIGKLVGFGVIIGAFIWILNDYKGVPLPVLLLLGVFAVFSIIAEKTVFGRRIYAVGGNLEATRLSGVNTQKVKMMIFVLMGTMCAFAGLVTTARLAAGSPSSGTSGELDAISACFLGGASMRGGSGTIFGAMIGALIIASLDNGMSMLGVETFWQMIVKGTILVVAVWIDVASGSER